MACLAFAAPSLLFKARDLLQDTDCYSFSWTTSNYAGNEQPMNPQYASWSSTATSNQPSPNRREHAVQPPLLTTALSGPQFHSVNTPLSTTSLSSPFTQSHSPYVTSPANGRSASSSSSMASRQPTSYSVPYNPQDWGPMGGPPGSAPAPYHQSSNVPRVAPQQRTYAGRFSPRIHGLTYFLY